MIVLVALIVVILLFGVSAVFRGVGIAVAAVVAIALLGWFSIATGIKLDGFIILYVIFGGMALIIVLGGVATLVERHQRAVLEQKVKDEEARRRYPFRPDTKYFDQ